MDYPVRKHTRLKNYDYSQNNVYYVTICVKDKKNILGSISAGRDSFYDEIIINENGYLETWQYIDENPLRYVLKKTGNL